MIDLTALETLFDLSPHLICIAKTNGYFVRINQSWTRVLGYENRELLSRPYVDFVHPDDRESTLAEAERIAQGGTALDFVNRFRAKNGSWVYLSWVSSPAGDFIYAIARDITQEKIDENNRRRLQSQFDAAQRIAQIGSWSFDVATKKISWSEQMYSLFPENPQLGPPTLDRHLSTVLPEDQPIWRENVERCIQDGTPYAFHFRAVHPDKILWLEGRGNGRKDETGAVVELYGTCQDTTDRIQLERELKDTHRFLQVILDHMPGPIYSKAKDGRYLFANKRLYEAVAVPKGDIHNMTDSDLYDETLAERIKANDRRVFEEKRTLEYRELVPNTKSEVRHYDTFKFPIFDEQGDVQSIAGISLDVTEKVNMEIELALERTKSAQAAKLASLGVIAAGIAHEINNPLAILAGNLSLMNKHKQLDEKDLNRVSSSLRAVERIARIVRGLQKFSRSQEKGNHQPHCLSKIIEEVLVLTGTNAKTKDVSIQLEILDEGRIDCDEVEIEQVLINLISNSIDAVQALSERWVRLHVDKVNNEVQLTLTDSGPGIPPEIEKKIFDPFFTTKPIGQGTGLGMSISKGIVEEHQGRIWIDSNMPNTCFKLTFPVAP